MANRADSLSPKRHALCLVLLRVGFTKPSESPRLLVSSYLTVSPLPRDEFRGTAHGGLLSVALSLASRPVGVTDHSALRSPDFPPRSHLHVVSAITQSALLEIAA